jgi:hypothetical protein
MVARKTLVVTLCLAWLAPQVCTDSQVNTTAEATVDNINLTYARPAAHAPQKKRTARWKVY